MLLRLTVHRMSCKFVTCLRVPEMKNFSVRTNCTRFKGIVLRYPCEMLVNLISRIRRRIYLLFMSNEGMNKNRKLKEKEREREEDEKK